MFKNCALPVEPDVIDEELQKHSKGVSGADTATEADVDEAVNSIAPLLEDLSRRVGEAAARDAEGDLLPCEFPTSEKGALTNPSHSGGQVGELISIVFETGPIPEMPFIGRDSQLRGVMVARFGAKPSVLDSDASLFNRIIWRKWGRPDGQVQPDHRHSIVPKKDYSLTDVHSWDHGEFEARMALVESQEDPVWNGEAHVDPLLGHCEVETWAEFPRCRRHWTVRCNELLQSYYEALEGRWVPSRRRLRVVQDDGTVTLGPFEFCASDGSDLSRWDLVRAKSVYPLDGQFYPVVRTVAVCEPLKVRVITVGNALLTLFSAWWQKTVHRLMQRYPCFKLLGRAPTTREVDAIRDFAVRKPGEALGYASSDFSGASNGTPAMYREKLMSWINSKLPASWRRVPEICNGCHWVRYSKLITSAEDTLQRTGTLMGERTSFPILSLEVLGAHVAALRRCYGNRPNFWRILKGVAINGDDRFAYTTKWADEVFWRVCNGLQFSESVGKSYWHPVYANINSQSYSSFETGFSVKTGYFASGLFFGQKKLATDEFVPSEVVTAVLDSCLTARMEHDVMATFTRRWKRELKQQLAGRNLFVPVVLGGCGHRPPQDRVTVIQRGGVSIEARRVKYKIRVTDSQQELASELYWSDPRIWVNPPLAMEKPESACRREVWDTRGVLTFWDMQKLETNEAVDLMSRAGADWEVLDMVREHSSLRIPKLSKDLLQKPARRSIYPRQCEKTWRLIRRGVYNLSLRKLKKFSYNLLVGEVERYVDHNVLLKPDSMAFVHRLSQALPPMRLNLRELGFTNGAFRVWHERLACT